MSDLRERTPDISGPDTDTLHLSAREAAISLGLNERTIRRAIATGTLPATKRSGTWQIRADDLASFRVDRPRPTSSQPARTIISPEPPFYVPNARMPLIGRDSDVAEIAARVTDPNSGLITLTGPGGSGKSRLAISVANAVRGRFADGISFVDLAPVRDVSLVIAAIAEAIGLHEVPGTSDLDRLSEFLAHREILLILDNMEQVATSGADLARLLTACPRLAILATSRIPLQVSMERLYPVRPLELPNRDGMLSIEQLWNSPAIELFCLRAQIANPGFTLTAENAPAITGICARLDGLPLAIELAAARCNVLTPGELAHAIATRRPVLTFTRHDSPPRHRSLHETIAWSYRLLDTSARALYRWLSVFTGGFTFDAAAHVARVIGLPGFVLNHLSTLVDSNIVMIMDQDRVHGTRYTMLETIREFGLEKLEGAGEAAAAGNAHADWYGEMALKAAPYWFSAGQVMWANACEREHDNLKAAWTWLEQNNEQLAATDLVVHVWPFWFVRGHRSEGKARMLQALAWTENNRDIRRVRLLIGAGCLWLMGGDEPTATGFHDEALDIINETGPVSPLDYPWTGLTLGAYVRGDTVEGHILSEHAFREYSALGTILPSAQPFAGLTLSNHARMLMPAGEPELGRRLAEQALTHMQASEYRWGMVDPMLTLAWVAWNSRQLDDAARWFREVLTLASELADPAFLADCLEFAIHIESSSHRPAHITRLLAAHAHLRQILGFTEHPDWLARVDGLRREAVNHLGDRHFATAWASAVNLSLEDTIALAASACICPDATTQSRASTLGITRREVDVLYLLAQDHTDQEIADTLFIGRRTVNTHVSHLLAKLNAGSRQEAVAIAITHDLLGDREAEDS